MTTNINQCIIKSHTFTNANNTKIFDWYHIDGKNAQAKEYLTTNFTNIDNVAIKALLSNEARPRATEHGGSFFNFKINKSDKKRRSDGCPIS
jgi:hypothetical protein